MAESFDNSDLDASRRIEASAKDIMNILQNFPHNADSPRHGASPRHGGRRSPRRNSSSLRKSRGGGNTIIALSSSSSDSSDDESLYATTVGNRTQIVEAKAPGEADSGGFVDLDILINNAFRAMQDHVTSRTRYGAALLTVAGRVFTACQTEGLNGTSVAAERVAILKAVSEGFMEYEKIVICSDQTVGFPTPDGASLQMLSAYGNFTICVVNATRTYQEFQSQELWNEYKSKLATGRGESRRLASQRDPTNYTGSATSAAPSAVKADRLNESADAFLREKYEAMKDANGGLVSADDARKFLNESRDHVKDLNSSLNFEQFKETVARELEGGSSSGPSKSQEMGNTRQNGHANAKHDTRAEVLINLDIGETVQRVLDQFQDGDRGHSSPTNLVVGRHDRHIITCFSKPGSNSIVVTGLEAGSTAFTVTNIAGGTRIMRRYVHRG